MAVDSTARRSRRALLASAVGGAAAVAATQLAKPLSVAAADPNDVLLGGANAAVALTSITQSTDGVGAFRGTAAGDGTGVVGESPAGFGVEGRVTGVAPTPAGVVGTSGDLSASAIGAYDLDVGVYGYGSQTDLSAGVWGDAPSSGLAGIYGTGPTGVYGEGAVGVDAYGSAIGVAALGDTADTESIGGVFEGGGRGALGIAETRTAVHGHVGTAGVAGPASTTALLGTVSSKSQTGIQAGGRVRFPDRSGQAIVKKGQSYRDVTVTGMTSGNYAYATLAQRRSGRWVAAVVCYAGKIRIHLNGSVTADTKVSWLVLG